MARKSSSSSKFTCSGASASKNTITLKFYNTFTGNLAAPITLIYNGPDGPETISVNPGKSYTIESNCINNMITTMFEYPGSDGERSSQGSIIFGSQSGVYVDRGQQPDANQTAQVRTTVKYGKSKETALQQNEYGIQVVSGDALKNGGSICIAFQNNGAKKNPC